MSDSHSSNAPPSMLSKPLGIIRVVNDLQYLKALCPILVMLLGMVIEEILQL